MGSRWRVIEAAAFPLMGLLIIGLWQGMRHQSDSIRALRRQLNELEQNIGVSNSKLLEEQLKFLKRRQVTLETKIGELRKAQQQWINEERQPLKRLEPAVKPRPDDLDLDFSQRSESSMDLIPIP